jgi:phosphoribosylaminoimidazole-succinocarboxamide synthase
MILKDVTLSSVKRFKNGKVREVFEVDDDKLLIVATDRISAFDYILPQGIPDKGKVLNGISAFWFEKLTGVIKNHFITDNVDEYPESLKEDRSLLEGRSMLVKKTELIRLECIVRGYIVGSGWSEYQNSGSICGITLPEGLKKCQKLEVPLFTPSTKPEVGHDENISEAEAEKIVGKDIVARVKKASLALYNEARDFAATKGIIIADTKFEFGLDGDELILIDEALSPDSSRFWPADQYALGQDQPSFDKQFVRDYLLSINWDKNPPVPNLPEEIIQKTSDKYKEAFRLLTGNAL